MCDRFEQGVQIRIRHFWVLQHLWKYQLCVSFCVAYGVQLSVDGESLSTGDPAVFTKPEISFSDCWKPIIDDSTIWEAVFSNRHASAAYCVCIDAALQQTAGLSSYLFVLSVIDLLFAILNVIVYFDYISFNRMTVKCKRSSCYYSHIILRLRSGCFIYNSHYNSNYSKLTVKS